MLYLRLLPTVLYLPQSLVSLAVRHCYSTPWHIAVHTHFSMIAGGGKRGLNTDFEFVPSLTLGSIERRVTSLSPKEVYTTACGLAAVLTEGAWHTLKP